MNPEATAAKLTEAETGLTAAEAGAYAQVADKLMRLPVVYVEYSGTYGDMELVHHVRKSLSHAQLFYGGGIRTEEQAREAAGAADTVVVGNIVYEDMEAALRTVEAVRLTP